MSTPKKQPSTSPDNNGNNPLSGSEESTNTPPRAALKAPAGAQETPKSPPGTESDASTRPKGLAALFEKEELKELLRTYLVSICVIEGLIFFACFLSQLGPDNVPFPWKSYFFAAFITPLVITFLLGIIVISFDRYIFGHQPLFSEINEFFQSTPDIRGRIHKFYALLYVIRQVPFLLGLLSLVALSGIAYKFNDILAVIGHVGERTAHYLLIALGAVLAIGFIVGMVWMFLSYNLRRKTLEYEYQYKKDVVEKTGLVLIGEDRVMGRDGRVLSFSEVKALANRSALDSDQDDEDALIIEP